MSANSNNQVSPNFGGLFFSSSKDHIVAHLSGPRSDAFAFKKAKHMIMNRFIFGQVLSESISLTSLRYIAS
jgi:hypothetical protein